MRRTPEEIRARARARKRAAWQAWAARNKDKRRVYWRERYRNMSPEKRAERNAQITRYRKYNTEAYRAQRRKYWHDNREALKLTRHLGIKIAEARRLLAAIPDRRVQRPERVFLPIVEHRT